MKQILPYLLIFIFLSGCMKEEQSVPELFTVLSPEETKVGFSNQLTETEQFNMIQYLYFNNGAGVAAGDINNDGLADLYFSASQVPNKLYLNRGNLVFEDITEKAGVEGKGDWKTGVTMADVNADGLLDIYVCQVGNYKVIKGRNQLFINQGDLTFRDEAEEYGLDFQGFSTQSAFFDYDLDGDLDMYLLNHSVHTSRSYGAAEIRHQKDTLAGDRLFRNEISEGRPCFSDVTHESGILSSQIGYGLGVNICDVNNDGWPDIYISNDFHEDDYFYINNGDGTFTERYKQLMKHTTRSSMGNDVGDFNNDGLLDVCVLDMLPEEQHIRKQSGGEDDYELYNLKLGYGYGYQFVRNHLQLNLGDGMFSEIGRLAGIFATDWSWSPLLCDLDNDGLKDLFISNGIYRRANDLNYVKFLTENEFFMAEHNKSTPDSVLYKAMPLYPYYNYIFRNNGDLTFSDMSRVWGSKTRSYSNGAAYADLDNDGDLELITNNINEHAYIYRNNTSEQLENNFLTVVLRGKDYNTSAYGARVTLYHNSQIQVAEQFPTRGFMSSSAGNLHFGLGKTEVIDSLVVRWPDLSEEVIKNVAANNTLVLDAGKARRIPIGSRKPDESQKLVSKTIIPGIDYKHIENEHLDPKQELLVPHSLTAEGPALIVADLNGDGLDDIFAGSASEQVSVIFFQQTDGTFNRSVMPAFIKDLFMEDVDAAAFDADGDNDNDLYIVRGGAGATLGDPSLADRLLINDGQGGMRESGTGSLPFTSNNGSCVAPCDFDNDGDIDLFVGSRSIPGAYGLSPNQMLMENDGNGNFTDVTENRMKRLRRIGMVTDACWIDYDNDGDNDLILTGEWMKVTVLRNDNGNFSDQTKKAGLEETTGWWNCIHPADIDNDGDIDLIGGNLGLNNVMKASVKEPVEMYLNDFDDNGTVDQVITAWQDGENYLVAMVDELKGQIAGLDKKYPGYSAFAGKSAKDIFGWKAISRSIKKKAVLFESCIFLNNGDATFETARLPIAAQTSPVRDICVRDMDLNGFPDILLVGNDYTFKPNFGRHDASYGWCLLGQPDRGYSTPLPSVSGFAVNGDARRVVPITVAGKQYILAGVNNGDLNIYECLRQSE